MRTFLWSVRPANEHWDRFDAKKREKDFWEAFHLDRLSLSPSRSTLCSLFWRRSCVVVILKLDKIKRWLFFYSNLSKQQLEVDKSRAEFAEQLKSLNKRARERVNVLSWTEHAVLSATLFKVFIWLRHDQVLLFTSWLANERDDVMNRRLYRLQECAPKSIIIHEYSIKSE